MRPPRPGPVGWTTLLAGVLALVVVAAMMFSARSGGGLEPATSDAPARTVTRQPPTAPTEPAQPVALRIPALGIDAPVVAIEMSPGGALVPPPDPRAVGWWSAGARPGSERGAALLTGHTVHDGEGVFDELAALHVGATVEVVTRRQVLRFSVRTVRDLTRSRLAAAASRLFGQAGDARLVLVTCSSWDGEHYRGNTVVVARGG